MRYTTADGNTFTVTLLSGRFVDVHVRNAAGESIATVRKPRAEVLTLIRAGQNLGTVAR